MDSFDKWLNHKNQEHASEVGNELGNDLNEMVEGLVEAFPRLSAFIGICTGFFTLYYGHNHWHFKPITLVLLSVLAGGAGMYFGLAFIGIGIVITLIVILLNLLL